MLKTTLLLVLLGAGLLATAQQPNPADTLPRKDTLLEEIKDEPVLVEFRELCKQHNIKTMLSMMSMTGAINVGPKSFALSFATEKDLV